jgi:hypothetical protein
MTLASLIYVCALGQLNATSGDLVKDPHPEFFIINSFVRHDQLLSHRVSRRRTCFAGVVQQN